MTCWTWRRVGSDPRWGWFRTLETVPTETAASRATSLIPTVARPWPRSRKVEDLGERAHRGVGGLPVQRLEELAHFGLPTRLHPGGVHRGTRLVEVLGLQVADEQSVLAQEERVIVPAGGGQ